MEGRSIAKPVFCNIIWHQHQPLYLDPAKDQLSAPWVRTHGTKDYHDMASILLRYPDIHVNVNLTSVLLYQLQSYYVDRLKPYVNLKTHRINTKKFFTKWEGKTDPWIDIMLKPTSSLTDDEKALLTSRSWSPLSMSRVIVGRFPQYKSLIGKVREKEHQLAEQDYLELKFWFSLVNFDPDFLRGPVKLASRVTIDLTDLVEEKQDGSFYMRSTITEDHCNRLVADTSMILADIIPMHKKLIYKPDDHSGQIEVVTTPFYHPILPLLCDSEVARVCQPDDTLPQRFHYPEDADMQVGKAILYFQKMFGQKPTGMWPGEGSVSHDIIDVLVRHGILWTATDEKILRRSSSSDHRVTLPYGVASLKKPKDLLAIVFRETDLSDRIGFTYKEMKSETAIQNFITRILEFAPPPGQSDCLLTIILDGENAWEWYRYDNDGKKFLNGIYTRLTDLQREGKVVTVTTTEYLKGNPRRKIPPHSLKGMPKIRTLWPGSWINANFSTWIGEREENVAWEYLRITREDLAASGIKSPRIGDKDPRKGTKAWYAAMAWEEMYAAEGSDWFWWYGADRTTESGDDSPFDLAFITHLNNIYFLAQKAGGIMPQRKFNPIVDPRRKRKAGVSGTMTQSTPEKVTILFQCDARSVVIPTAIFIVGNIKELGEWKPNVIRMYDDGTHGDITANDGIWTLAVEVPSGTEIRYKFTNSGMEGEWEPGEEFPDQHRFITTRLQQGETLVVLQDIFGKI
jgi:alpha-amylase/alpha-mannosidase (GH57 family)